jgi:sugar phosphate isomerase/epimerase
LKKSCYGYILSDKLYTAGEVDMWQEITMSTCSFTADPADEAGLIKHFEMAVEAGFDGFELTMVPPEYAATLHRAAEKSGAKIVAVHGILNNWSCSPDAAVRKKAVDRAWRYLEEFAGYAPCPIVEHYFDRFNAAEPGKYFRDTVEELLTLTEKAGFIFCMENAPYKPEYDERFPCVAEIAEFTRSFGKDRMFMTFDLNHANLHEDPVAVAAANAGLVRHIHVSDNHGLREEHLVPGRGVIDFAAVLTALYRNGYQGPCNLEFHFPKGTAAETADYREVYNFMANIRNQCGKKDV